MESQSSIKAIRGMKDILPEQIGYWHFLEQTLRQVTRAYGYNEIRLPIVESTNLFKRSIGEVTDIVEKEMYTFEDRNGDSLSLRPEGTASCVRACLEHSMLRGHSQRLWYMGPMFRHERPQKGRYRQFYQFGVEAFGMPGPDIDAEIILMTVHLWRQLGLQNQLKLQLNSLGTIESRKVYREQLVSYFKEHYNLLDEDSRRRLETNPLRILDSKNLEMQTVIAQAPKLISAIDDESAAHFDALRRLLDAAGVAYDVNPYLVRGLDYYGRTVFEWVTDKLGAQGTVCAGGRYDGLVETLGGAATPAIGFAMGIERLVSLLAEVVDPKYVAQTADAYLIMAGEQAQQHGFLLAEQLREKLPNLVLLAHCGGGNFKKQFKKADKSGARLALILGEEEVIAGKITIKYLREEKPQETIPLSDLPKFLETFIAY